MPFKVIGDAENDKPTIVVSYNGKEKQFSAEVICSKLLMKMKEIAEASLGVKVMNAVITVPAYFNDSQRRATKDVAVMAGFKTVCVINEPTAIAIAYGLHKQVDNSSCLCKNVLVFNLGGRILDVSVLTINKDMVEYKAVHWRPQLGGDNFDMNMAEDIIKSLTVPDEVNQIPIEHFELLASCEKGKRTLSTCHEAVINVYSKPKTITRETFEKLNEDLFKECIPLVEKCLRSANMKKTEIHDVVLVGGSSRIPKVRKIVEEFFSKEVIRFGINPGEVVAFGAAIHASMLSGVDVSPTIYASMLSGIDVSPTIPHTELLPGKLHILIYTPLGKKRPYVEWWFNYLF